MMDVFSRHGSLVISGTVDDSIVDGPGLRYSVFVQGCPHHCPGCHNPQTHSFEGGSRRDIKSIIDEIRSNPLLYGVTFSGGEPFCQPEGLYELGLMVKEAGLNLMVYTGFTYEELLDYSEDDKAIADLLSITDILVDGRYEEDLRDLTLLYRGSSNQRVIDLQAMRAAGDTHTIIEYT